MEQEFPNGERVIFLGSMAYGTAAQVASTTKDTLDISLAVGPLGKCIADLAVLPYGVQGEQRVHPYRRESAFWKILPFPRACSPSRHLRPCSLANHLDSHGPAVRRLKNQHRLVAQIRVERSQGPWLFQAKRPRLGVLRDDCPGAGARRSTTSTHEAEVSFRDANKADGQIWLLPLSSARRRSTPTRSSRT
jgi:hypothetical protein